MTELQNPATKDDRYDLLYGTIDLWLLNEDAIMVIEIDETRLTDQWCSLITVSTIRLVGNEISGGNKAFDICTVRSLLNL